MVFHFHEIKSSIFYFFLFSFFFVFSSCFGICHRPNLIPLKRFNQVFASPYYKRKYILYEVYWKFNNQLHTGLIRWRGYDTLLFWVKPYVFAFKANIKWVHQPTWNLTGTFTFNKNCLKKLFWLKKTVFVNKRYRKCPPTQFRRKKNVPPLHPI